MARARSAMSWMRRHLGRVPDLGDRRVSELAARYRDHPAAALSLWTEDRQRRLGLPDFRSDNHYMWQRDTPDEAYERSWRYACRHDTAGVTDQIHEDGAHGVHAVEVDGRPVSRDLIDSALELQFLLDHVPGFGGPDRIGVLDIGAGYGRLARRATEAFAHVDYHCVDAVPISTALCEFYLAESGSPARTLPLDEIETTVAPGDITVAVNVNSFNECPLDAIRWWAGLLERLAVEWLFVVPNDIRWLKSTEEDGSHLPYEPALLGAGYTLVAARHKYHRSPDLQTSGVVPEKYLLFQRQD